MSAGRIKSCSPTAPVSHNCGSFGFGFQLSMVASGCADPCRLQPARLPRHSPDNRQLQRRWAHLLTAVVQMPFVEFAGCSAAPEACGRSIQDRVPAKRSCTALPAHRSASPVRLPGIVAKGRSVVSAGLFAEKAGRTWTKKTRRKRKRVKKTKTKSGMNATIVWLP